MQDTSLTETGRRAKGLDVWSLGALLLAAFYLVTSVYIAGHRLYWFDELFVVRIAQLPRVATMWAALAHASDTMPPGYHLLMRVVGKGLGYGAVAMRAPSALAMIAGMLVTFDCVRRLTDGLHGLIALSLLSCSFLPYYGYEARPYAFYFMLSALAFWIWSCTRDDSTWAAILFGAVLGLAVTMHYYAVLNIVPYVLWEFSRWRVGRRASRKLIAGVVGVALPAGLLSPLAMAFSRQFSRGFWAHPSFHELREVYSDLFPDGLFLLAMMFIWIVLSRAEVKRQSLQPMSPAESLGWFFLFIPLAGFVLAELKTNAFLLRYFIGALPGLAVAFSCWLWRQFHDVRRVSAGILALLAVWGAACQWSIVRHPESVDPFGQQTATRQYLRLESSLQNDGRRFIVFANPMLHLEAAYYSRHPELCVLLLAEKGGEVLPTARIQVNLSQYSALRYWRLDDLKAHAAETALIDPAPEMLEALKQAGVKVDTRFPGPLEVVYLQ